MATSARVKLVLSRVYYLPPIHCFSPLDSIKRVFKYLDWSYYSIERFNFADIMMLLYRRHHNGAFDDLYTTSSSLQIVSSKVLSAS